MKPGSAKSRTRTRRRPRLGQHFLTDHGVAGKIVAALGDISARNVIEIGPGRGILTEILARKARRLIAIEFDRMIAAQLRIQYATTKNVEIIEGQAQNVDFESLAGNTLGTLQDRQEKLIERSCVVGNLPYYVTSEILLHLFSFYSFIDRIVIMVQREVADRIAAKPGGRDYGLLSATAQLYARVESLFTVPPGAFNPPPDVYSTVIRLDMAPQLAALQVDAGEFIEFLKLSFGQKRKTLMNNLKSRYEDGEIRAALKKAGVRGDARAETLSLENAAAVFNTLKASGKPT